MKFLSIIILFILSNATFASGGGASLPFIPLNPPSIVNIIADEKIRHMQVIIKIKLIDPVNSANRLTQRSNSSRINFTIK